MSKTSSKNQKSTFAQTVRAMSNEHLDIVISGIYDAASNAPHELAQKLLQGVATELAILITERNSRYQ